jgi:hypothetical protein
MRKYKNHIPITKEMYQTLDVHKERTGIGGRVLLPMQ